MLRRICPLMPHEDADRQCKEEKCQWWLRDMGGILEDDECALVWLVRHLGSMSRALQEIASKGGGS